MDAELATQCVEHWGMDAQCEMVVEECAELILAIKHTQRRSKHAGWDDIVAEMVDVEIMLEQLAYMAREALGIEYETVVHDVRKEKERRLFDRIDAENGYID